MTLFRHTIDRKLKKHNINALVSQRLKRIPSIVKKLEIQENMQLSRMQDIGGLQLRKFLCLNYLYLSFYQSP
jgi:(p)ppGpp synthase/HD superfamily hydrolase